MEQAGRGHLIAIVDDDEMFRRSIERLVKSSGYRTETFGSAEDFLDRGDLDQTACLILDMKLPGMTGADLQRRLRALEHRIPIVFVSAHDDAVNRGNVLRAGAIAFLRKPFEDRALLEAIGQAVN